MDVAFVFYFSKNICFISAAAAVACSRYGIKFKHLIPSDYQSIP
jgi:hypothetical protein